MNKKITRRNFFKKTVTLLFTSLIASTVGYIYARFIEPKQVKTNYHIIKHSLIPRSFNNLKIVQFSDTHVGHAFNETDLSNIVNKINEEKPDVVIFTGDLMDDPLHYENARELIPILSKIKAPYGKFSIYGNHDHGGYGTEIYEEIMKEAEFQLLKNSNSKIEMIGGQSIYLAGVDDLMLGRPSFPETLTGIPQGAYTILLVHEPDLADEVSKQFPSHLQLSGHTHGGQVQIPFVGPIITPPLGSKYVEGFYQIDDLTLYVNRGLGTTRQPYRFFSPPEITVFTLQADSPNN